MPEQSRRSFLKFLGIGGGIAIGGQEIKRFLEKSVSTRYARYFFIPEVHSRPASPDLFPSQVDCIYKERVGPIDVISAQMYKEGLTIDELKQEVEIILTRFDKIPTSVMTDEDWSNLLNELKQERELLMQGKKLAWGDIGVGSLGEYFSSRDPKDHFFQVKMALTLNALSMLITGIIFLERKKRSVGSISRRRFLKISATTFQFLGLAALAPNIGDIVMMPMKFDGKKLSALERVAIRINALTDHLAPYDLMIFFRDVYVALLLLTLGEHLYQNAGEQQNIAYVYGAAHGGIEDFLLLGKTACVEIIKLFPNDILSELAKTHGGFEKISSCKLAEISGDEVITSEVRSDELYKMMTNGR